MSVERAARVSVKIRAQDLRRMCANINCGYKASTTGLQECPICGSEMRAILQKDEKKLVPWQKDEEKLVPSNVVKSNPKPTGVFMKLASAIALTNTAITTIGCVFANGDDFSIGVSTKVYTYKVTKELAATLKPNDFVVIEGPASTKFKVVQVAEVHEESEIDPDSDIDYKWVISKVDIDGLKVQKDIENATLKDLQTKQRIHIRENVRKKLDSDLLLTTGSDKPE